MGLIIMDAVCASINEKLLYFLMSKNGKVSKFTTEGIYPLWNESSKVAC